MDGCSVEDVFVGEGEGMVNESTCYPVLHIAPADKCAVAENLMNSTYSLEDVSSLLAATNGSAAYYFPFISQDVSDEKSERTHFYDSAALLLIMFLLFLTVITIWIFRVRRFRVFHETGLAMLYGELKKKKKKKK